VKKMNEVQIDENKEGEILLSQPNPCAESGHDIIILTKDQLPLVIKWLQEIAG